MKPYVGLIVIGLLLISGIVMLLWVGRRKVAPFPPGKRFEGDFSGKTALRQDLPSIDLDNPPEPPVT